MLFIIFIISASNLKINGTDDAEVNFGDTLIIEVNLDKEEAKLKIYYDANQNKILDNSDFLIYRGKIIDGSWKDKDEEVNGYYMAVDPEGSTIFPPGRYICVVDDGNPTEAKILFKNFTSDYGVHGKIYGVPNVENILVRAYPENLKEGEKPFYFSTFTDEEGNYTIFIPESLAMRNYFTDAMDIFCRNPEYMALMNTETLYVDGMEEHDINFIHAEFHVSGELKDQNDSTLNCDSNFVFIYQLILPDTLLGGVCYATDSYELPLKESSSLSGFSVNGEFPSLYPQYMEPVKKDSFLITGVQDDIDTFNITIYEGNTFIEGHVNKDHEPADEIEILCEDNFREYGYAKTGTYSDGHYKLLVYSANILYKVAPRVPEGCSSEPEYRVVPPSVSDVDFEINCSGVEENLIKRLPQTQITKIIKKKEFNHHEDIEIFSIDGKYLGNGKDIKKLSPGIYYIKINNKEMIKVILVE